MQSKTRLILFAAAAAAGQVAFAAVLIYIFTAGVPLGTFGVAARIATAGLLAALGFGISCLVARRALAPLARLARAADDAEPGSSALLPTDAPGDVGRVARAFERLRARVRAQSESVREQEDLFLKAFRLSPDCVAIVRMSDRRVIRANDTLCEMWGRRPEEVIDKVTTDFVTWVSEGSRQEFWQKLSDQGECLNWVSLLRLADGRERAFDISSRLINFQAQRCILSVMRDVTERQRMERDAARLSAIVQSSNDAIIGKNLDGVVTSWNEGARKIFGYDAAEMIGQSILRLIPADRRHEEAEILARVRRGERTLSLDTVRVRKDGSIVEVSISTSPIRDATGQVIGASKIARDITERRAAEAELRLSEERFRTMADSMPQLAWIAGADGYILWYNQRWFSYTGTTPQQMEGWGWKSVHDPLVLPEVMTKWQAAIDVGQPFEMEFPLRSAEGKFRVFLTRVQPIRNADGTVIRWFGTNTDVDELKRVEESLRATRNRLQSTLSAGSIGTWTWELGTDRLQADEFTARIFGLDPVAAADGLPVNDYLRAVLPEDQPAVSSGLGKAIDACGMYDIEYRVLRPDGGPCWIHARGRVEAGPSGKPAFFHGAVMNINARKLAEEAVRVLNAGLEQRVLERTAELDDLYNNAPCGYHSVDENGMFLRINDTALRWLGYTRDELVGKKRVSDLFTPASVEVFNDVFPKFVVAGRVENVEFELIRRNGTILPVLLSATSAVDEHGNFLHSRTTIVDYSERKQAELAIRETQTHLEAANKELEAFSYSVSHDLRAPLRAVDGFSQAVVEDFGPLLPAEGQRQLQTIRESAQRMGDLIDDLLTFSRLSRQPLLTQSVNMEEMVKTTLEAVAAEYPGRDVHIAVGALPPANGDPSLLRQVWQNLISNAFKYTTKRAEARVEIGARPRDDGTEYYVQDNGAGFDMQYAHKLFGVFQRLHRAEEYEGTGVGLAIVERIVERHGGRVWADAIPGRGATFYFNLR